MINKINSMQIKIYIVSLFSFLFITSNMFSQGVAEKDLNAYLFTYFTGNNQQDEAIRFAVSYDGYSFFTLNNNEPILNSKEISSKGGVRDPHIIRTEDGKSFYMVATDMVSSRGWNSNRAMVLLKSNDLINWTSSVVNIQDRFKGHENLLRVWAPQTIYDHEAGKYMLYWSMKHGDGPDIIYYSYVNRDFTDLETEPKQLFIPKSGTSCIDGDIVLKDSIYHLFYKTEGHGNGIKRAITCSLTSDKWKEFDHYVQKTNEAVEGSSVFKLNHENKYILMYDVYTKGEYHFTESSDLTNFSIIDNEISMDFRPRHGSILSITHSEVKRLFNKWGKPAKMHEVVDNNPILEGYYADPDVLYSNKTGKYYLYPTSDGFMNWGGYYFKTFSSDNLKDWKDEGIILDLKKDVDWADKNAWAPDIIEKKTGRDKYKYYYYFTAAQKIGVAVAEDPAGPFVDSGKPLIASRPEGVSGGQEIDPNVFYDPVSKKDYLYWGNGYLAVAELNKDMVSIKSKSVKVITPDNTFREGVYVVYRKGTYYFLWSENDTRSQDYRVRYGTSKSPLGPIEVPANNLILEKDSSKGIYGTGHNSILQIPGTDEWYIVYHRFNRPNGIKMGESAGFHREVCIDKLEFNEDGTIRKVIPTI